MCEIRIRSERAKCEIEMANYVNQRRTKTVVQNTSGEKNRIICCYCFLIVQPSLLDT